MNTKNKIKLSLILVGAIALAGCSTTCKLSGVDNARFNENVTQTIGAKPECFVYTSNNKSVTNTYQVPVVVKTVKSWEDTSGNKVTVESK